MKYFKNCLSCISYCIIFHSNYIVHKYTNIYVLKNDQKTHIRFTLSVVIVVLSSQRNTSNF